MNYWLKLKTHETSPAVWLVKIAITDAFFKLKSWIVDVWKHVEYAEIVFRYIISVLEKERGDEPRKIE